MTNLPRPTRITLLHVIWLVVLVVALLPSNLPTHAQPGSVDPLHITSEPDGVRVAWRSDALIAHTTPFGLPTVEIGGLALPAQLIALRLSSDEPLTPRIEHLVSVPWTGPLTPVAAPIPQTATGELRPDLATPPDQALPDAPVLVLREGRLRGARLVVVAISPIFAQAGAAQIASDLQVLLPGAQLLTESAAELLAQDGPFLATAPGPSNPAAGRAAVKIRVTQPGIQRISAQDLAAAGINLATIDPARLRLQASTGELSLELRSNELRFYAPDVGDRWNRATTYWLTVEAGTGNMRMATRDVTPRGAYPPRDTALERGTWRNNRIYDTTQPGPDGDHWYAADLRTGPGQNPATLTVPLTPTLPLAQGNLVLTVASAAYTQGPHTLEVAVGTTSQSVQWQGTGNWTPSFVLGDNQATARLRLLPGAAASGIEPSHVSWERPVMLNFAGNGAAFVGVEGTWRYQLTALPANATLYDVSDSRAPQILSGVNAAFEDGPMQRQYIVAGPGTLHTPTLSAANPVDLATPLNADVLYIAPAAFHSALQPLVALRQAQGYRVRVVDVQAIYDAWSFGQVAPAAIRSFLRYAAATWSTPPRAVTLVGDGTADPFDYLQKGVNNVNLIPPYLAMVDPNLGETACETCFVQLDGDSPVRNREDPAMLPDVLLGRLPVKSVSELQAVVTKINAYETDSNPAGWRARSVFIADNADNAGDFADLADAGASLQPAGVNITRIYYDPDTNGKPGRYRDPATVDALVQATFNAGAGFVTYIGHGNPFQWGTTDSASATPNILSLYDPDTMNNARRLPIVLALTCMTSAFHYSAFSGTSIDERLLLRSDGGAIAVWGSTGVNPLHGHGELQRGFFNSVWSNQSTVMGGSTVPKLGTLTVAGFLELFNNGGCCQDAIMTSALLGDPLTTAGVLANAQRTYIPLAVR